MAVRKSGNTVTSVTTTHIAFLYEILQLISHNIPISNFNLKGNDLETQFSIDLRDIFISNRLQLNEKIRCRQIIYFLTMLIENNPGGFIIESIRFPIQNLEYFLEMLRSEFAEDADVKRLLENSIWENLMQTQN